MVEGSLLSDVDCGVEFDGGTISNFTTAVAMQVWLASGNGDIASTSSIAFPAFATAPPQNASGATLSGTFNLTGYIKVQATPETTFAQTPGGTGCSLFSLNNSSTAPVSRSSLPQRRCLPGRPST